MNKKNERKTKDPKKEQQSEVLQRLTQGAVEGVAMEVALNAAIPGAGLATNMLKGTSGIKQAAKIAKKGAEGAAKEGVKMLDSENDESNETPLENLANNATISVILNSQNYQH